MKLKNVINLCKAKKCVILCEDTNADDFWVKQWIGDWAALYPLAGMPELDTDAIVTIFDIPEKSMEKWRIEKAELPPHINFEDYDPTEKRIDDWEYIHIEYNGMMLKPLKTDDGISFINTSYLAPIVDVWDLMDLYARKTLKGDTYIVAKAGMIIQAVIMPARAIDERLVCMFDEIAGRSAIQLEQDKVKDAQWEAERDAQGEENEEMPKNWARILDYERATINPETGEIIADKTNESETEDADAEN